MNSIYKCLLQEFHATHGVHVTEETYDQRVQHFRNSQYTRIQTNLHALLHHFNVCTNSMSAVAG
jgi:hypothetical protein